MFYVKMMLYYDILQIKQRTIDKSGAWCYAIGVLRQIIQLVHIGQMKRNNKTFRKERKERQVNMSGLLSLAIGALGVCVYLAGKEGRQDTERNRKKDGVSQQTIVE